MLPGYDLYKEDKKIIFLYKCYVGLGQMGQM